MGGNPSPLFYNEKNFKPSYKNMLNNNVHMELLNFSPILISELKRISYIK